MTVVAVNLAPDNTSDITSRAWGKGISDALTSCGIIKTGDTGQIDWATVVRAAANTSTGYEIRQFTDSLQSSAALFLKIEYGQDTSNRPTLWFTFGRGSNGTGTLTGVTTTRQNIGSAVASASPSACIISGNGNRFCLALWFMLSNGLVCISCERVKDSSGNDTPEGILINYFNAGVGRINQYYPFTGFVPPTQDLGVLLPLGVTSGVDGSDVNYYPNIFYRNGTPLNPGINQLAYFSPDANPYSQAPIQVYGVNRNYYFLGNLSPINTFARGGTAGVSLAILYE